MTRLPQISGSPVAIQFAASLKTTEHDRLLADFSKLLTEVNQVVVVPKITKGKVKILGSEFNVSPKPTAREIGRDMARTRVANQIMPDLIGPTQLILRNTNRSAELKEIAITIPNAGNSAGKLSLISVTNKDKLKVSFTPSLNTFIQMDPMKSGRTRITAEAVRKEN